MFGDTFIPNFFSVPVTMRHGWITLWWLFTSLHWIGRSMLTNKSSWGYSFIRYCFNAIHYDTIMQHKCMTIEVCTERVIFRERHFQMCPSWSRCRWKQLIDIMAPSPWWRHQMEIFSALLSFCAGILPVTAKRPVTRGFDVFFELRPNKWFSKQWRRWWFETPSRSLWRHWNDHR